MADATEFDEFNRDLQKIEELIQLVIQFRSFGAQSPLPEDEQDSFTRAAHDLHSFSGKVRTDLPILVGSLLLYACGRFEYFVGELVRASADREIAKAGSYAEIPKEIQGSLRERLIAVLSDSGKFSYLGVSDQQLAETLSRIVAADDNVSPTNVPTSVLALTESNMRAQILKEVFGRAGRKDVWSDISKQAPLRTHFDATSEGTCKTKATNFLDELMRLRNSIAHPTGTLNFPSPEEALKLCGSLRALSRAISDVAYLPR